MNEFEQFEAWIEKRVIERVATRGEVYALRRLRRSDTPTARAALFAAYWRGIYVDPIQKAMANLVVTLRPVADAFGKLARQLAALEADAFQETDLGEFDNRAHDWLRFGNG